MDNKNLIIKSLKESSMSYDLLKDVTNLSDDELKIALDELLDEEKIRLTKKSNVYKINKKRSSFYLEDEIEGDDLISLIKKGYTEIHELSRKTNMSLAKLKSLLHDYVESGEVRHINGYRGDYYTIPVPARISVSEKGNVKAFVEGIDKSFNIYGGDDLYDSDTVSILPLDNDEHIAVVDKIIERGHPFIVGIFKAKMNRKTNVNRYYIESSIPRFKVEANVLMDDVNNILPDMIVTAELKYYNNGTIYASNLKVVGHKDDPGIKISEIALEFGFNLAFNDEVKEELKYIPNAVNKEDLKGRRDFRDLDIITIDGDDSKDFDDAVYLEELPNGNYSLGVYIADVSHYVKEGSPLDKEALKRGTSLYLADRVIPMLPHELSNGICSLNPDEDRLVLACIMEYSKLGKLINYEICEGVINSHHRMTYNKVNKILNGDQELIDEYSDIAPMLKNMEGFSKVLRELRHKKGGIEFDTVEYSFRLNSDGSPKEIIKRERMDAEKLIEDFMLAANETVAYHMNIMNLPIVYRIHEKPDQDKLRTTFQEVKSMGLDVKITQNDIHPKQVQDVLEKASDNPNKYIINNMLLRSMMKAKYSSECLGHYGLAMNYYCHFTSPIRRYPDLMTHRMIKKLLLHPTDKFDKELSHYSNIIPEIALKNSSSERRSVDCEREVDDMLYAWYMESKIGNIYQGTVTSIQSFGMFVEIENGIEGLILYRNCEEYFEYDEKHHIAYTDNEKYYLGKKVMVKCIAASKDERKIDFEISKRS
ncbi:MAG: ribonuclease R [Acholeplasmatales bacterium]|nr:ribonuclease R [Acholeplasmatales bacterium]